MPILAVRVSQLKPGLSDTAVTKWRNCQNKLRAFATETTATLDSLKEADSAAYREALHAYADRFRALVDSKLHAKREEYFKKIGFPKLPRDKALTLGPKIQDGQSAHTKTEDPLEGLMEQQSISELEQVGSTL